MAKSIKLVKGRTYTYKGQVFLNGVPKDTDDKTFGYLLGTGKFKEAEEQVKETKKVKIKKPDESKKKEEEESGSGADEDTNEIPNFRSKKELADYAKEEHGLDFGEDFKSLKMADMVEELEAHINSEEEDEEEDEPEEPALEV